MRRILSIAIILGLTFVGDSTAQSGQPVVAEVAGEAIPAELFRTRYIDYLLKTGLADASHRRAAFLKRLIRVKLIVQEAKAGGITEAAPYEFEKEESIVSCCSTSIRDGCSTTPWRLRSPIGRRCSCGSTPG